MTESKIMLVGIHRTEKTFFPPRPHLTIRMHFRNQFFSIQNIDFPKIKNSPQSKIKKSPLPKTVKKMVTQF